MRITDVSAVYPKWKRPPTDAWQSRFWQIVVRVEADDGTVGYGYGGGGDPACLVVNRHFRDLVVGRVVESVDDIQGDLGPRLRPVTPLRTQGTGQ